MTAAVHDDLVHSVRLESTTMRPGHLPANAARSACGDFWWLSEEAVREEARRSHHGEAWVGMALSNACYPTDAAVDCVWCLARRGRW